MNNIIPLRYEKFQIQENDSLFLQYDLMGNFPGIQPQDRYRFSQVIEQMVYYYMATNDKTEQLRFQPITSTKGDTYIIPTAVAYHPNDWTDCPNGVYNPELKSPFEYLNPKFVEDLQNRKALLLLDQSVEGYNTPWIWEWFHNKCVKYNIDPAAIIYITGDQSSEDNYIKWCEEHNPKRRLFVLSSTSLAMYIHKHYVNNKINANFDELLAYKKANSDNIYLYDCINMRPRPQRVLNFLHLLNAGLIDKGNISMPARDSWQLSIDGGADYFLKQYNLTAREIVPKLDATVTPRVAKHNHDNPDGHYYIYVERILNDLYKNSWVSLVTESSYFDREYAVFIGEKTFKPIACLQPFIILGSKGTLKYLRKLGYRTFDGFIDESYDDMEDADRFGAVANAIKQIDAIEDKAAWYESMRDILEHNHKLFLSIDKRKCVEHDRIVKYYFNYFKEQNV